MTPLADGSAPMLLRLLSLIVPQSRRVDWMREWRAEQLYRGSVSGLAALRHALTLRVHELDSVRQDLTYAVRGMVRRPGFSLAVVLTLAVGIGANAGVFSLINTVLLRPLPLPNADRLFLMFEEDSTGARQLASFPTFLDWEAQSPDVFASIAFVRGAGLSIRVADETGFVLASFVTAGYFRTFDVKPAFGRTLVPDDFREGAPPAVVLSHDVWVSLFRSDTNAVGTVVRVDEVLAEVVGVLPANFALPRWTPSAGNGIWMPVQTLPTADRAALMQRDFHADSRVVARLDDGVTLEAAQLLMNEVARRLAVEYPATGARWTRVGLLPQRDILIGDVGPRLYILGAAVVAVLLICCVNLANLFLVRGASRSREFAVRSAIGAGQGRVFRQLLTECLMLTVSGGVLGTGLALFSTRILRARLPAAIPRLNELTVDWRVIGYSLLLMIATGLMFAWVSSRQTQRGELAARLRQVRGGSHLNRRVYRWLIIGQVALSVVLLLGAGLLVKSMVRVNEVNPGFDPDDLATVMIQPRLPRYRDGEAALDLYIRLAEAVRSLPGVKDVGLVNHVPFSGGGITTRVSLNGDPRTDSDQGVVFFRTVSPGYFALMGIPVVSGREFTIADMNGPEGPVIVNESLARRFGEGPPIGASLGVLKAARDRADFGEPLFGTVVGVVGDIRHFGLESSPVPVVYVPVAHNVWSHIYVVAETNVLPEQILEPMEAAVRALEPGIPLEGLGLGAYAVARGLDQGLAPRRFNTLVVLSFAAVALSLALIGVYGVTSYAVARQAREIGIRLALGARPSRVSWLVLTGTARLVVTGLGLGLLGGLYLTRFMSSVLFDVEASDPTIFSLVALLMLTVGTLATVLPARRAAWIDPAISLKT